MELEQNRGGSLDCYHPYVIGDSFIKNCKLCGLFLPKVIPIILHNIEWCDCNKSQI